MNVKSKYFDGIDDKDGHQISCCGDTFLYQIDGWDEDDWLCADDFLNELIENDYEVIPALSKN